MCKEEFAFNKCTFTRCTELHAELWWIIIKPLPQSVLCIMPSGDELQCYLRSLQQIRFSSPHFVFLLESNDESTLINVLSLCLTYMS